MAKGAKLGGQLASVQPIDKEQHHKGGFVHTLTANDGTKAQVYLSRNGAHAGIVFRNEISRGKPKTINSVTTVIEFDKLNFAIILNNEFFSRLV